MEKTGSNEKGFTLIEMAIVLVIIGIILGAVMKGQDLIENARHKKLTTQTQHFETLTWAFLDRKGYFPGDSAKTGKISGDVKTDLSVNARFLDAPQDNKLVIGSYTFYYFFGNDGTKNIITICKSSDCQTFTNEELAYAEAFDTAIDGSADGILGRVQGSNTAPTLTGSASWVATLAAMPSTSFTTATRAVVYYFDRK